MPEPARRRPGFGRHIAFRIHHDLLFGRAHCNDKLRGTKKPAAAVRRDTHERRRARRRNLIKDSREQSCENLAIPSHTTIRRRCASHASSPSSLLINRSAQLSADRSSAAAGSPRARARHTVALALPDDHAGASQPIARPSQKTRISRVICHFSRIWKLLIPASGKNSRPGEGGSLMRHERLRNARLRRAILIHRINRVRSHKLFRSATSIVRYTEKGK